MRSRPSPRFWQLPTSRCSSSQLVDERSDTGTEADEERRVPGRVSARSTAPLVTGGHGIGHSDRRSPSKGARGAGGHGVPGRSGGPRRERVDAAPGAQGHSVPVRDRARPGSSVDGGHRSCEETGASAGRAEPARPVRARLGAALTHYPASSAGCPDLSSPGYHLPPATSSTSNPKSVSTLHRLNTPRRRDTLRPSLAYWTIQFPETTRWADEGMFGLPPSTACPKLGP